MLSIKGFSSIVVDTSVLENGPVECQNLPFDEFESTRWLTEGQREYIQNIPINDVAFNSFVGLLNLPTGMREIAMDVDNYKVYPMLAVHALLKKKITEEQFATLCMLYAGIDQMCISPSRFELKHNYETCTNRYHRLDLVQKNYSDYRDNPLASTIRAHSIACNPQEFGYLREFFHLTEEGMNEVFDSIKDVPESEKVFLTFTLSFGPVGNWSPLYHRINAVTNLFVPVNSFGVSYEGAYPPYQPQLLVVPSFTLFQAANALMFKDTSVKHQPVLGRVSTLMITDYKQRGIRLINIGIPGIDVPEEADGYWGGKIIFTIHDMYHALRDSVSCPGYQLALRRINKILHTLIENTPSSDTRPIKKVKWRLNDGENFTILRHEGTSLILSKFGIIFREFEWPANALHAVIGDMVQNKEIWTSKFSIVKTDLDPREQKVYEVLENGS